MSDKEIKKQSNEKLNELSKWINENSNDINILDILNKIAELTL